MEHVLSATVLGFATLLTWPVWAYMVGGVLLGMFFGLVPGLSGLTGMALLLPFAFGMQPEIAFAMLMGMYAATTQTDTIPAVLMGVPGTAAAMATTLDGYPMAQRGEAGRALSASYMASIIGALVGAVILIIAVPVIGVVIRQFGGPEFFMLAVLGLTMAGSLSGPSMVHGLTMAAVGLLFAMVGQAPNAISRYDFDIVYLWEGFNLVPVVLGLFAVPEVVDLLVRGTSIAGGKTPGTSHGALQGIKDTLQNGWMVVRCAVIGAVCGFVPGLGGTVAEWMGYGHAAQSAGPNSQFGKGDVRGVMAPEAATAAQKPGALIPTVAFGIPGNTGMALMLGVFLIVGLRPGPQMLVERLDVTFLMVWTIVLANVIAAALSLGLQRWLVLFCYLRPTIIAPAVLAFMLIGAYMANRTLGDLVVFTLFGVAGYLLKHTGWPRAPFILGIVLGGLAEQNLYRAVDRYEAAWLWERPVVVGIIVLMALSLFAPKILRTLRRSAPVKRADTETQNDVASANWAAIRLAIGVALVLISAGGLYMARDWSWRAGLFPWLICIAILIFAVSGTIRDWRTGTFRGFAMERIDVPVVAARLKVFAALVVLVVAIAVFGFYAAVPVFVAGYMILHREPVVLSVGFGAGVWAFIYFVLDKVIHVPFEAPYLLAWIGR